MNLRIPRSISMSSVVNFLTALLLFVLMVDPSGNIFRIKIPLFSLLILCCIIAYPSVNKYVRFAICLYSLLAITSVISFFACYDTNSESAFGFYMNFMMIWLLPWIHKIRILEYLRKPAVVISLIVLVIYIAVSIDPKFRIGIYAITNSSRFVNTILLSSRQFLGFDINSVYFTSAPVLLLLFSYLVSKFLLFKEIKTLFFSLLVLCPLLMGGTRAMMFSSIAILGILLLLSLWNSKRGKPLAFIGFVASLILGFIMISMLLNDHGEESLEVKKVLADAFFNHIDKNPSTLLWGNGVGSTFDSLGVRGDRAVQSELFYLEIVRWFGIPLSICFLLLYLYPIYLLIIKRHILPYSIPLCVGFTFYLFLSGTNPYLLASNGFVALLSIYSYALNPYYEHRRL